MRLKLGLIIIGVIFAYQGFSEAWLSIKCGSEPAKVSLADIEKGENPDGLYVEIGEHFAVYPEIVYEYSKSKYSTGGVTEATKVNHGYYAIISEKNPFFSELAAKSRKYGSFDKIPDNDFPTIDKVSVIVKTDKFKTVGDIPDEMVDEERISGMIINDLESLGSKEKELITESYKNIDHGNLIVLEENRKPAVMKEAGIGLAGAAALALGLFWTFGGLFKKEKVSGGNASASASESSPTVNNTSDMECSGKDESYVAPLPDDK